MINKIPRTIEYKGKQLLKYVLKHLQDIKLKPQGKYCKYYYLIVLGVKTLILQVNLTYFELKNRST